MGRAEKMTRNPTFCANDLGDILLKNPDMSCFSVPNMSSFCWPGLGLTP